MGFFIRLGLTAIFIAFLLPLIPGVTVTSSIFAILGLALVYRFASILMALAMVGISLLATVLTAGLALLVVWPAFIISFWLLPSLTLWALSAIMPSYLHFDSGVAVALAGLVMFVLHFFTDRKTAASKSS
jgi:hypothetical protein